MMCVFHIRDICVFQGNIFLENDDVMSNTGCLPQLTVEEVTRTYEHEEPDRYLIL